MATVTKLMFDIESKYNGLGLTQARKDLQRFSQQLSQLEKKRVRANVELNINRNTVDKKIREVEATKPKVMVELDVDVDAFNAKMRTLQGGRVTVQLDPDMAELERRLAAARDARATIETDADTATAETQINRTARDRNSFIHVHANNNTLTQIENNMKRLGMAARVAAVGVLVLVGAFYLLGPAMAVVGALATVALPAAFGAMAAVALAKNEEVKASFEALGNTFKGIMTEGANSIKSDIIGVSGFLQEWLVQMKPQIQGAFGAAGDLLLPLTQGITNLVSGALPGLTLAMQKSGPILDGFKAGMNSLGIGIGSMFNRMTEGATGLGNTWRVLGDGLGNTFEIIGSGVGKMAQTGSESLRKFLDGINNFLSGFSDGAAGAMEHMAGGTSVFFSLFSGLGEIFRIAGPSIGQFTETLSNALGPAIDRLAPALGQLLSGTLQAYIPVIQQLAPIILMLANALAAVMEWASRHPIVMQLFLGFMLGLKLAGPLMALVGVFKAIGSGVMAVVGAVKFLAPVFGILKIAIMGLFSMIMAHPVVAAIVAIIAVITLLVLNWDKVWPHIKATWELLWGYIKTSAEIIWTGLKMAWEFLCNVFRATWDFFVALFKPGWDALWNGVKFVAEATWNFLKAAWNNLVNGIKAIWDFVSLAVSTSWNQTWETIKNVAVGIWNFLKGTWEFILNAIKAYWDAWSAAISAAWNFVWNMVKDVALAIWNWIKDRWNDFLNGVRAIWDTWSAAIKAAWDAVWNWVKDVALSIWNWIKDRWNDFLNGIRAIWDVWSNAIKVAWDTLWNAVKAAAEFIWGKITEGFTNFKNGVIGIFESLVSKASEVWNAIKGIFATPINWVIGVWNDHVADKIGLGDKKIPKIEGYADGGLIGGNGYGRADDRLARVSSGEYIVNERSARNRENRAILDQINYGGGMPAFRDGGPVEWMVGWAKSQDPSIGVTSAYRATNDYHGQGKAVDLAHPMDAGGISKMIALAANIASTWGRETLELIHGNGFTGNIKDGRSVGDGMGFYGGGTMAGHNNHVHWAVPRPLDEEDRGGILGMFDDLRGAVSELLSSVWQRMTQPILDKIPSPFLGGMGGPMGEVPKGAATEVRDIIGGFISAIEPKGRMGVGGPVGGEIPVGDRARIIEEALALTRTPPPNTKEEWMKGMNTLITRESGWNPNAVNNWDSNAAKGTPSKGLAQTIDPTFQANKVPGHDNVFDPVSNVAASINYIKRTYGDISNVQQAQAGAGPKGYRDGTKNARKGWNLVGENGPEMMKTPGGASIYSFDDIVSRIQAVKPEERMGQAITDFGKSTFDTFFQDLTGGSVGGVTGAIINDVVPYVANFDQNRKKMFEEAQGQQPGNVDPNVQNMQTTSDPTNSTDMEKYDFNKDGQLEDDEKIRAKYMIERQKLDSQTGMPEEDKQKKVRYLDEQIRRAEEKITKVGHQGDVVNNYYVGNAGEVGKIEKEKQRLKALGYADV